MPDSCLSKNTLPLVKFGSDVCLPLYLKKNTSTYKKYFVLPVIPIY